MTFTLIPYNKPPKTIPQLVRKLQQQGLVISNPTAAEKFLERNNYYRFRGYLYPYLDRTSPRPWQFTLGTTFEQAEQVYNFDHDLRHALFGVITKLEVLIRTRLDATMSSAANDSFWYLNKDWFKQFKYPQHIVERLHSDFVRSREDFAEHYHKTYYNQVSPAYKGLPPFWVSSELTTFGQVYDILKSLDINAAGFAHTSSAPSSTPLDKMAQSLGAPNFKHLISWMESLRTIRNLCAHHSRLWNRNLRAPQGLGGTFLSVQPVATGGRQPHNTCYAAILIIRQMCKAAGIADGLRDSLAYLFWSYPEVATNNQAAMGAPANWDTCIIWQP